MADESGGSFGSSASISWQVIERTNKATKEQKEEQKPPPHPGADAVPAGDVPIRKRMWSGHDPLDNGPAFYIEIKVPAPEADQATRDALVTSLSAAARVVAKSDERIVYIEVPMISKAFPQIRVLWEKPEHGELERYKSAIARIGTGGVAATQ